MISLRHSILRLNHFRYIRHSHTKHTMAAPSLALTPSENLFRNLLLDCREEMRASIPAMNGLELRWTGGWVRDKLLGTQSHDIDVALSTMTGEDFGKALKDFMEVHGQKYVDIAKSQEFDSTYKDFHTIEANPEKSKHLATMTTRMFGIDADFVNLRKEVYDDKSRNPQIEFGTPEEDSLRRDATVNALFYNLDSKKVEDFTGLGLEDMGKKIIRTPLAPYQTFKDDPLRVLRLIRFASRLGYEIEPAALEAMKDKTIHQALRAKISRERVGVEVGKIMTGPDPLGGLLRIYDRDMFGTVFANPFSDYCPDTDKVPQIYRCLQRVLGECSTICLGLRPDDDPTLSWTLATYVPWMDSEKEAVLAARESIRATNNITKVLGDAVRHRSNMQEMVKAADTGRATRVIVGTTLRKAGPAWRSHVLYSLLCELAQGDFEVVTQKYVSFLTYVQEQELWQAAGLKPLLNGNEVKKALEIVKAGPWLKDVLDVVVEWQFDNPKGTADDAKAMLAERRNELNLG